MRRYWIIALLLLVIVPVSAQSEWTVVEHCIEQTRAPEDWTYEGTILLRGYGGLHGVNADWDTPRVVARAPRRPYAIALSPDGFWYATLEGVTAYSETYNHTYYIHAIVVYSTVDRYEVYRLDWFNSWLNNGGYRRLYWYDNQRLLYETRSYSMDVPRQMLINPFTGETTEWTANHDFLHDGYGAWFDWIPNQYPSPDFDLSVRDVKRGQLVNRDGDIIAQLDPPLHDFSPHVAWSPDGLTFVAEIGEGRQTSLALFNREGEFLDVMVDMGETGLEYSWLALHWSPDSRYLAFVNDEARLYIADTQSMQVTDTCMRIGEGMAWSPDSRLLAFTQLGRYITAEVRVLDVENGSMYAVARHIVQTSWDDVVIGWRADE